MTVAAFMDLALYDPEQGYYARAAQRAARAAQRARLGEHTDRLVSSRTALPDAFEGVLIANELLDAMPTHQVVKHADGRLREIYVSRPQAGSHQSGPTPDDGRLTTTIG